MCCVTKSIINFKFTSWNSQCIWLVGVLVILYRLLLLSNCTFDGFHMLQILNILFFQCLCRYCKEKLYRGIHWQNRNSFKNPFWSEICLLWWEKSAPGKNKRLKVNCPPSIFRYSYTIYIKPWNIKNEISYNTFDFR